MSTVRINGHHVKVELREIVENLLAYADERDLSKNSIQWGWSIKVNRRPIFQIQVSGRTVGVVPQFRYMRSWNDESIIHGLRRRLGELFDTPNPQFPTISLTRLQNPKAFTQLCRAFDWFLEQINISRGS
jgi:hypothetical protein